jgi:large subunit ribosomal protein L16
MGKGKGSVEFWAAVILPGRIIFEMGGVEKALALEALQVAAQKLPLKVKIVEASEI